MRYLINLLFFLSFIWISPTAFAALSAVDEVAQTQNLEALSIAWGETGPTNTIFTKPEYTAADWEAFFHKYFNCAPACAGNSTVQHSFTDDLSNYLGYPVFSWFGNDVHLKLQMALINPLWVKINDGMSPYVTTLGTAMANDVGLRQSLFNSHLFFTSLTLYGVVDTTTRTAIYNNYKSHIDLYLQYFSDARTIDSTLQPWVSSLRARVWKNFGATLPQTPALNADIAATISLRGQKLDIWNTLGILIIDNNGLDSAQLTALSNLLNTIPVGLRNLRSITVSDFFGLHDIHATSAWPSVNTFSNKLVDLQQQFPSDIATNNPPPIFMSAAAHEINHNVDSYQYTLNPTGWGAYKLRLLAQTGRDPMQFLRCGAGDPDCAAYLVDNPGEFFAGLSNQYITDSWHTLDHAVQRFNNGYKEPINQFLLFANVYTQALATTKVYTINSSGAVTVIDAAVTRDAAGRIVTLRRDDASNHATYQFTLDTIGNVISYRVTYDVPTVSPTVVSNIKQATATLTATVNTNGGAGRAYAQCKTGTADYTAYGLIPAIPLPQQPINGSVVFDITGLTGDTAYTCRIGAWNIDFDAVSAPVSFTTLVYPPTVVGSPMFSNIQQTTATMTATVNTNGDPSGGAYAECKLTSASDTSYAIVSGSSVQFSAPVNAPISVNLTGLTAKTSYTCRMAAWGNHMGNIADTRGMSGSFTTLSYDPIAVTLPATLVAKTTATLNGSCDFKGLAGTAKFEYWKVAKVPVIITTVTQSFAASPSTYLVKQAITGLAGVTNYTYRVKCINASATVNGSPVTFKTTR